MNTKLKAKLIDWLKLAGCVALGFPVLIYFFQERLLFQPQPLTADPLQANPGTAIEEIDLVTSDRVHLRGWLVKASGTQAPAPLLVYFGGNAEEVSWLAATADRYAGWSLLLVNYRGYGRSEGKPGEAELFSDALQIYDYAAGRAQGGRVAVMGRSLGSGVAVYLAAERKVAGVILVSPYDSVESVARGIYPHLPIGLMLKHRFDSLLRAPKIKAPLLCLVASDDRVIPRQHSERLYAAWGGPRQWREIGPAGHDSLAGEPDYWQAIADFLANFR
ncbi:MAG: alpha/beta hydrolase [Burkholderiales bacterium]|nr:alpha/beta hydrolase [Burkholderiales bacterium]